MHYSTYEEYLTQGGTLPEQDYVKQAEKAAREIDLQTFGRAQKHRTELHGALSQCECALVDAFCAADAVPAGIASESNDGYSIAYTQTKDKDRKRTTEEILARYLLEPVNLLFAGVMPCDFQ